MVAYAVVERALARMHGADPRVQQGALRGRIKHLQRLGLPFGEKPGKGKRIDYSDEQIWQLALALELSELGLDPTAISEMLTKHWKEMFVSFLEMESNRENQSWQVLKLSVSLMSANWRPVGSVAKGVHTVSWITRKSAINDLFSSSDRRAIVIDVHRMIRDLEENLKFSEENT